MSKSRMLDSIVIVDLESTCYGDGEPEGEREIIEIGVCELDVQTWERRDKHGYFVRPQKSEITPFCTKLTGHTPAFIEMQGMPLKTALYATQTKYHTRRRVWASYGDYDRRQFERECADKELTYPFGTRHINVKTLFALVYGLHKEVGMDTALDLMKHKLEGRHHNGADDAWNIAGILAHLLSESRTAIWTRAGIIEQTEKYKARFPLGREGE